MDDINKYYILPFDIVKDKKIKAKCYYQKRILDFLIRKHELIFEEIEYEKISLYKIFSSSEGLFLPDNVLESLEILSDDLLEAEKVLIENINQEFDSTSNAINDFLKKAKSKYKASHNKKLNIILPVFTSASIFYQRKEVKEKVAKDINFIEKLVDFFAFLTKEGIEINIRDYSFKKEYEESETNYFLYNNRGDIKYFINHNILQFSNKSYEKLTFKNINMLLKIFNFYLSLNKIRNNLSDLFRHKCFERVYGRLDKGYYNSFDEIKKDLEDNLKVEIRKRIGVFIDVANIFKGIGYRIVKQKIDFEGIISKIYGKNEKIQKYGVMFYPEFNYDKLTQEQRIKQDELKKYLEKQGFKIEKVKNGTPKARVDNNLSIDDQKLINKMDDLLNNLDEILIMTGDKDFFDIAKEYKDIGKEVTFISVRESDTEKKLIKEFNHFYLREFWEWIGL